MKVIYGSLQVSAWYVIENRTTEVSREKNSWGDENNEETISSMLNSSDGFVVNDLYGWVSAKYTRHH